jgi:putative Holliday junction resolvase
MRYLALDVGNKRIGTAVGSSETRIASPLTVIVRTTPERDVARLLDIVREYDIDEILVGLPRNANNTPSEQEARTRSYVEQLMPALGLPVRFFDERYSTAVAMQQQRARGLDERRGRATLDATAAAVILQDFFDSLGTRD